MEFLIKNSVHTAEITGYASDGSGVCRIGGQVVFVKNALRGETCRVRILKAGKNAAYGKIEELTAPSPHRVTPGCPVYGKCGGCGTLHMDYAEELEMKREKVSDALKRIGGVETAVPPVLGGAREAYRNKVIFAVSSQDGRAVTGFFRPRSHDVVPAESCLIQAEPLGKAAAAVRRWMDRYRVSTYDEHTGRGTVRHVFCRLGRKTGQLQVTLVSGEERIPHPEALTAELRAACPETASVVLNVNKTTGNTVLAGSFHTLWGADAIEDELCGLRFSLSPRSFYQVNRDQAERLYETALQFAGLTGEETVLDLYCGTGTITLCLARCAARAVGCEIVPEAVWDAEENARKNGIGNAEFLCGDAGDAAELLEASELRPDVIVADPPRKGMEEKTVRQIAAMAPARIVYVSCDPATLARDLARFSALGYRTERVQPVDMFPGTPHVECVVLMTHNIQ